MLFLCIRGGGATAVMALLLFVVVAILNAENTYCRPSSADCKWRFETMPLDHFAPGQTDGHNATYQERVCVIDKFVDPFSTEAPAILFYTGNESPVEIYVNDTGLMFNLAEKTLGNAYIVFAEHRYFGESVPQLEGVKNCLAYATSQQALADYAVLIQRLKTEWRTPESPVIAFGGSYGGMLASWFRFKYPNVVDGAIAGSAPIWGFPSTRPPLDGASIAITRAASAAGGADVDCASFMNVLWPLIEAVAKTESGRSLLSSSLGLCTPMGSQKDAGLLLEYLQAPWFLLSEGDYPFKSNYIPFAVGPGDFELPKWPMREACARLQTTARNYNLLKVTGSLSDVRFSVQVGSLIVNVDWDQLDVHGTLSPPDYSVLSTILSGLSDSVGVWYNVSGELECFDYNGPAPHAKMDTAKRAAAYSNRLKTRRAGEPGSAGAQSKRGDRGRTQFQGGSRGSGASDTDGICTGNTVPGGNAGGWDVICCNEALQLVNGLVQGAGNDLFWPPNVPRNYDYDQQVRKAALTAEYCQSVFAQQGLYGVAAHTDVYSKWENTYYGGLNIGGFSNVIFSNGLLDPWSSAGVLVNVSSTLTAATLKLGAHHLDLMWPTDDDPQEVRDLRAFEAATITKWISEKKARRRRLRGRGAH